MLLAAVLILGSSPSWAESEEERAVFPKGKLKGQPLDISSIRSIRFGDEARAEELGAQPGDLIVENVKHNGQWYTARIPAGAVETTHFQSVIVFKIPRTNLPLVAHSQLRFSLSQPAALYEPGSSTPVTTLNDLTFTQDALGTGSGAFSPLKTLLGRYVAGTQLMSSDENFFRFGMASRFPVRQWKLDLTPEEGQAVLESALTRGDDFGYEKIFGFCGTNCTTTAFGALSDGRPPRRGIFQRFISGIPYFPPTALKANGIGFEEVDLMQDEFKGLRSSPKMRNRLKALIAATKADRDAKRSEKRNVKDEKGGGNPCSHYSSLK